tara:strand:+ start:3669 stop:3806 length:138 start_codon:yes stop_codon:yes gene_type:complete
MKKISEKEAEENYVRHVRVLKKEKDWSWVWIVGWILLVLILARVI